MRQSSILACAALFAMAGAIAAPATVAHGPRAIETFPATSHVLYDNSGTDSTAGIVSTNYIESSLDIYDSQIADDFYVPRFRTWSVTEVDAQGFYVFGKVDGPAKSEHVTFYRDLNGKPGAAIADYDGLKGIDIGKGSFMIAVPPTKLEAGHYWVSIVANMRFLPRGEWAWRAFLETRGSPAQWQNPDDGFATGCTSWQDENVCVPFGQGDNYFMLKGKSWLAP